jgi:hypothetical protein
MWRSLLATALLAGIVAAVAGAARDPWDPRTKIRAGDQVKAAASVLTRADLGGAWAGGARKPISFKAPTCPAQQPNDGDLILTGHAESVFSNGNGGMQVDSDVEVYASARQALRALPPAEGVHLPPL